jgi:hypothetical protein
MLFRNIFKTKFEHFYVFELTFSNVITFRQHVRADKMLKAQGLSAWYFFDATDPMDTWVWVLAISTNEAKDQMAAYEAAAETKNQEGF